MTSNEIDYKNDNFDNESNSVERGDSTKFKKRRRPEYCKKRTPVRQGMARRSNRRRSSTS